MPGCDLLGTEHKHTKDKVWAILTFRDDEEVQDPTKKIWKGAADESMENEKSGKKEFEGETDQL